MNKYIAHDIKGNTFEIDAPNAKTARIVVRNLAKQNKQEIITCKRQFENGRQGKEIMQVSDRLWHWDWH